MNVRTHVIFKGKVQGVFFRANTRDAAVREGVFGWVRNLPDGTVEAVFEGDEEKVSSVIKWCKESQPYARVDGAVVTEEKYTGEFRRFEVRR